jgi:predicted acyltransferase
MNRSLALDVFRGLTVALMILVNNPGTWSHVYAPFAHAKWHGLTLTDLVFPFFIFAIGNALALVMPRLRESGEYGSKVFKRTLIIFTFGFFMNWFPGFVWIGDSLILKSWTWMNAEGVLVGLRILGVLQRIALAYGLSALILYFFEKKPITISIFILLLYWLLCYSFGTGDVYSLDGWFGTEIDRKILGEVHLYQGEGVSFDPEGLMSTLPCISQVLLGYWAGTTLLKKNLRQLIVVGLGMLILGWSWDFLHPINKKIWTGSYVLVTTGFALWLLSAVYWLLDVKGISNTATAFFEAYGKNPLFIYILSLFVPKTFSLVRIPQNDKFLTPLQWFYENVCANFPGDPKNGSLLYSLVLVGLYGFVAIYLDKKKIYFKV